MMTRGLIANHHKTLVTSEIESDLEQRTEVVLISMPFGPLFQPSLGLSLLKASLAPLHIPAKVLYFTLRFAELIGSSFYARISNPGGITFPFDIVDLIGEWLFAGALFDPDRLDTAGYLEQVLHRQAREPRGNSAVSGQTSGQKLEPEAFIPHLLKVRGQVDGFLDACLAAVTSHRPRIVGFTSLFQQHIASLALAKRIKAQAPEIFIVFGGANCEGAMGAELIRQFPFVDAVVSGEGERVFPELVQRVLAKRPTADLQGVYAREGIGLSVLNGRFPNAPLVRNMDALPWPDYQDFFEQWETSRLDKRIAPRLLYETSRGCWWGERNHCTFCGMNGGTMAYRSKSAARALDELISLTGQYPNCSVSVVDNILELKYFNDFIPELTARRLGVELFYESKSNLRKEQVRQLRDAGITAIQPGIESLSSRVLGLMRKGVRGLQNIQLLKWCKELGVRPFWNVIWGFPGEPPEEYARMAELIPWLAHLPPPDSYGALRLDRFSPNFEKAEQFGLVKVEPCPAYRYIYPLAPEAVENLAYYFTFSYREPQDVANYTRPVAERIAAWQAAYEQSELFSLDTGVSLLICDLRPVAQEPLTVLTELQRVLYLACDSAQTISQLQRLAGAPSGRAASAAEVEELLRPLVERSLMVREDGAYLSLAIPLGEYSPANSALERFNEIIKSLGLGFDPSSGTVAPEYWQRQIFCCCQ
jgi:ribosomal peptide maturation radical SAM protein 1